MKVIDRVYELRKSRGDSRPRTFEKTVQQAFERHCGESDVFPLKNADPALNLFCFPEGKGAGIWGLNHEVVERYVRLRDKTSS